MTSEKLTKREAKGGRHLSIPARYGGLQNQGAKPGKKVLEIGLRVCSKRLAVPAAILQRRVWAVDSNGFLWKSVRAAPRFDPKPTP